MASPPKFRIFHIPVTVDFSFVIVPLLIAFTERRPAVTVATWVLVVFVSVLWHEMGHALVFRAFGYSPSIRLHGLGGVTTASAGGPIRPGRDFLISIAGPGAGFLMGGAVLLLRSHVALSPLASVVVGDALWVNFGWGVLNCVPMLPLDGGRVMVAAFNALTKGRGLRPAMVASLVVAAAGAAVALAAGQPSIAILAGILGASNISGLQASKASSQQRAGLEEVEKLYRRIESEDLSSVAGSARAFGVAAGDPVAAAAVSQALVWILLLQGQLDDAASLIQTNLARTRTIPVLHPSIIRRAGGRDEALSLLRRCFDHQPGPASAVLVSLALIEAGRLDEASAFAASPKANLDGGSEVVLANAFGRAGRYGEAAAAMSRRAQREGGAASAYQAARAFAQARQDSEALAWLARATDAGFRDGEAFRSEAAFAPMRDDPAFQELARRIGVKESTLGTCYRHPQTPTTTRCTRCARWICRRCTINTGAGRICPECAAAMRAEGRRISQRPPLATTTILLAIAAVFVAQTAWQPLLGRFASYPLEIAKGQWWRLITPMFLHAGLLHIAFNSYALYLYGPALERQLGLPRFVATYFVAGFAGGAASYAFGPCMALGVGASGAIFGLIGALMVFVYRRRQIPAMAASLRGIVSIIGLNLALGFIVTGIDKFAHMGGLVGGIMLAFGLDKGTDDPPSAARQVATVAIVAALAAALVAWRTSSFSCP